MYIVYTKKWIDGKMLNQKVLERKEYRDEKMCDGKLIERKTARPKNTKQKLRDENLQTKKCLKKFAGRKSVLTW